MMTVQGGVHEGMKQQQPQQGRMAMLVLMGNRGVEPSSQLPLHPVKL
jgi:hypothetical protein